MPSVIPGNFEIVKDGLDGGVACVEVLVPKAFSLPRTLTMQRLGGGDPTGRFVGETRFEKAGYVPTGAVTVSLDHDVATSRVRALAWGDGAAWVLDRVPGWLGRDDDPTRLGARLREIGDPPARLLLDLMRQLPGMRFSRSPFPGDIHTSFALQQRVRFADAAISHHQLVKRYGADAPGPLGLRLFPTYAALKSIPSFTMFEMGIDRNRAIALLEAARLAGRLHSVEERHAADSRQDILDALRRFLMAIPRTGVWTAESVLGYGYGDPDAVPLGDVHLPHMVSFALASEPFTSDERMVELLEPYRGERLRVIRLVVLAGPRRPYLDKHAARRRAPEEGRS